MPLTNTTNTAAYLSYQSVPFINIRIDDIGWRESYPAVAAKSSARLAFVKSPTLAAKSVVNAAMMPSFFVGETTAYRQTIAPINRAAALKVLRIATKREM